MQVPFGIGTYVGALDDGGESSALPRSAFTSATKLSSRSRASSKPPPAGGSRIQELTPDGQVEQQQPKPGQETTAAALVADPLERPGHGQAEMKVVDIAVEPEPKVVAGWTGGRAAYDDGTPEHPISLGG